jgi:hypothetical protein
VPYFDAANLERLTDGYEVVPSKVAKLVEAFLLRQYVSPIAREYAHHGVARRLGTLARCIDRVYSLLPPELDEVPGQDVRTDATIFIQAFVFNAYGVLDNLALVWVNERNIRKPNGQPLPNGRVGLTKDKEEVRQSFSAEMRAYLEERDPWFTYLENFRHSLGHRIPLYIPPYILDPKNLIQYESLDLRMSDALRRSDLAEHSRLEGQRDALTHFRPWMKQSFADPTPPVVFHAQVLADFATVEDMSLRMLAELNR